MNSIDISLVMPSNLGSRVVSREVVRKAVSENPSLQLRSVGSEDVRSGAFKDFGATLLLLTGTAVGVAAVEGIFNVLKTVIQEAFETWRQRYAANAEFRKLVLLLGHRRTELDLSEPLETLVRRLEALRLDACKQTEGL